MSKIQVPVLRMPHRDRKKLARQAPADVLSALREFALPLKIAIAKCRNPKPKPQTAKSSLAVNSGLPPPLLSRFDLVVVWLPWSDFVLIPMPGMDVESGPAAAVSQL